jgi:hypothetical protein
MTAAPAHRPFMQLPLTGGPGAALDALR